MGGLFLLGPVIMPRFVRILMLAGGKPVDGSSAFFDLTIIGWLLWRRTRLWAFLIAAVFHLLTWLLFPQIGAFPWLMMGGALIFFPADWPKTLAAWVRAKGKHRPLSTAPGPTAAPGTARGTGSWLPRVAMLAIAVYFLVQVMVPLRHYAYPGNVRWNEEGYRFSWRVLLTEKVGLVEYRVRDPASGQSWRVGPEDYLTPLQAERAATQPDMMLDTAKLIAGDFAVQGYPKVQVYADAFVSMNGREHRRLIDPAADLAGQDHGLAPKEWLLDPDSHEASPRYAQGEGRAD